MFALCKIFVEKHAGHAVDLSNVGGALAPLKDTIGQLLCNCFSQPYASVLYLEWGMPIYILKQPGHISPSQGLHNII